MLQISTEKILEKYFSEYEQYHKYTLISLVIIMVLYQIWQAIYISKKIETIKLNLKKSEIKFSRFQNMQIDALKKIYDLIVDFHYKHNKLFVVHPYGHKGHIERITHWQTNYSIVIDSFHRERILLPNDLLAVIKRFENQFNLIFKRLNEELETLQNQESWHGTSDENIIYNSLEAEDEYIQSLMNGLQDNIHVKDSEKIIRDLRSTIENYFAALKD